jgi:hypothetical protein
MLIWGTHAHCVDADRILGSALFQAATRIRVLEKKFGIKFTDEIHGSEPKKEG